MEKILIPEGYTLPEDVTDGGTLEELVTFTVDGDYLIPTAIAGVELETPEETTEEEGVEEEEGAPKGKALKGKAAGMSPEAAMGNIGRRVMSGMGMA